MTLKGFDKAGSSITKNIVKKRQASTGSRLAMSQEMILQVPIDKIYPNPDQPRKHFSEKQITNLAQTIQECGVLQPITIKPDDDGNRYMIIMGERRWRAAQVAGLKEIPARVRNSADIDVDALVENLHRADLLPLETGLKIASILEDKLKSAKDLGQSLGMTESEISRYRKLAQLSQTICDEYFALSDNQPPFGVLYEIAMSQDPMAQANLWQLAKSGATVQELRAARDQQTVPETGRAGTEPTDHPENQASATTRQTESTKPHTVAPAAIVKSLRTMNRHMEQLVKVTSDALDQEQKSELRALRDKIDSLLSD